MTKDEILKAVVAKRTSLDGCLYSVDFKRATITQQTFGEFKYLLGGPDHPGEPWETPEEVAEHWLRWGYPDLDLESAFCAARLHGLL